MYSSRWWQSASRRISNRAPDALPIATQQHRAIYQAPAAGNSKRAEAAMRRHLATNTMLTMVKTETEEVE